VEGVGRETGAGVLKGWFGDLRAVLGVSWLACSAGTCSRARLWLGSTSRRNGSSVEFVCSLDCFAPESQSSDSLDSQFSGSLSGHIVYLVTGSKSRNFRASVRYLASSAPRLGPETCTSISIGGVIICLHCGCPAHSKGR
jgi:hypothetical protein